VEVDFDKVRRERERGLRGLGQPLKSFRDRRCEFPVYQRDSGADCFLHTLGPLVKPADHDLSGLSGPGGPMPESAAPQAPASSQPDLQ
jgi:hypothetical protein